MEKATESFQEESGRAWSKTQIKGFPGGPVVRSPPAKRRDTGSTLVREDSTHRGAAKLSATTAEPALSRARAAPSEDPGPQSREQLRIASARSPQRAAKAAKTDGWLEEEVLMQRSEGGC